MYVQWNPSNVFTYGTLFPWLDGQVTVLLTTKCVQNTADTHSDISDCVENGCQYATQYCYCRSHFVMTVRLFLRACVCVVDHPREVAVRTFRFLYTMEGALGCVCVNLVCTSYVPSP